MRTSTLAAACLLMIAALTFAALAKPPGGTLPSPPTTGTTCDSTAFLQAATEAEKLRVTRRITAAEFARMAKETSTVVLDARSKSDHDALRIKGSVNLPYTEMASASLARTIPDRDTRIIIYCRNNILDTRTKPLPISPSTPAPGSTNGLPYPDEFDPPMIPKSIGVGLNIPTYITLYIYGYRNVWELDPAIDPNHSVIEFESGAPQPALKTSA